MKTFLAILPFLFWLFPLFFGVRIIIDWRRHKRVMRLFEQHEEITKQFKKAVKRGDPDAALVHFERQLELGELIDREMKKI